jgi:hypothetical protein
MTEIFQNFQLCAPRSREPRIGDCGTKTRSIACYHVYAALKQQYLNLSWSMSMDAISKMSNFCALQNRDFSNENISATTCGIPTSDGNATCKITCSYVLCHGRMSISKNSMRSVRKTMYFYPLFSPPWVNIFARLQKFTPLWRCVCKFWASLFLITS